MSENLQSIRAITFDLDDTLWDIWPIIDRAEQRLHDWLTEHHPQIPTRFTTLELRHLADEIGRQQPHVAHDKTILRKQALALAARQAGCAEFCPESAFAIFYAARNEVEFFEDVLPVLERLSQRYTLGALSNGNADIRLVGLGDLFDFSINAVDVGAAKPAPAMFEAACRLLNLSPGQILHVGDDPEYDVLAAARAGMRTVWVNRTGRTWPGGPSADAEIASLAELADLLAGYHAPPTP